MNVQRLKYDFQRRLVYIGLALLISLFSFSPLAHADGTTTDTSQTQQPAPATSTIIDTSSQPAPDSSPTTTTTQATPTETPAPEPSSSSSSSSEPTTTAPTTSTVQGPQSPPGADSDTYTYNKATGLWENSKYTWNPVTKQTSPKQAPTYSYNPETGHWDTTQWIYDAPSGKYVPNIISTTTPPEGATLDTSRGTPPTGDTAHNDAINTTNAQSNPLSNSGNSPFSNNSSDNNNVNKSRNSSGIFDLFYNSLISNNITSNSTTGDALVNINTLAGNALSGDATAIATIFNLLQTIWSLGNSGSTLSTFTQNIFGNLVGDLWLQPPATTNTPPSTPPADVTVNASQDAAIHNTINLEATSGDATVANNTKAGDATTGSATVVANIINAINSSIASGSSFVGMLNIYGSLNGDILLPQDLISTLLASNAIGTLNTDQITNSSVIGQFTNNLSTTNNVDASATSGNATVDKNTSSGSAATGHANTNVTLLNLTGRQVVGKDALLVFVNVLGKWVGMIVNAPTGATSAALGGGVTQDKTLAVDQTNNQAIVNDINAHAASGDALVTKNTSAGNATSGDAMTAVNVLNLNDSQFALSNWFGILFINVFGSWTGSFGIDTPAGTVPISTPLSTDTPSSFSVTPTTIRAYRFVPNSDGSGTYHLENSNEGVAALASAHVLSGTTNKSSTKTPLQQASTQPPKQKDWTLTFASMAIGLSLLGTERVLNRRNSLRNK